MSWVFLISYSYVNILIIWMSKRFQLILHGRFISSLIGSKDLGILNCDRSRLSVITWPTHTDRVSRNLIGWKPVCKSPYSPGNSIQPGLSRAYVCWICSPRKHDKISSNNVVLGRRCREITEFRPKNKLFFLKNEEDVWLLLIEGSSYWNTSRGWVSQLDVVSYLFWYDPFYHGNFKFKAKLESRPRCSPAHFQLSFRF